MANGLDKLERLFSARKKSASSRATAESNITGSVPESSALPETLPPLFPQAPFIRPTCNVMYARDELDIYSPNPLAHTNSTGSRRRNQNSLEADSRDMADQRLRPSSFSTTASFHAPNRSSLLSRRHNKIPTGFVHVARETATVDYPTQTMQPASARPLPLRIHKQDNQIGLLEALPIYPTSHVETPPPSDQDDFSIPSLTKHAPKPLISTMSQLTPEPSPDMLPCRDSVLSELESQDGELKRESLSAPSSKRVTASTVPLLDDDWRDSYIPAPQESTSPEPKIVFDEPHVREFLSLTDDDLAEIKVVSPSKPPKRRAPPPPILSPNVRTNTPAKRIMTPQSPHVASNEVAAWEAARIAKKYDFDVVYVANFWPSGMNHLHNPQEPRSKWQDTKTTSPTSTSFATGPEIPININSTPRNSIQNSINVQGELSSPVSDCCPNSARTTPRVPNRLNGCLLAGYGLDTIQAPFRLSARLHKKILRSEGWIEHRNSEAKDNEFARGYARSFYTGTVTASAPTIDAPSRRASAPEAGQRYAAKNGGHRNKSVQVNRGIVFVAFRRPRGHGGTVHSSQAELNALEREAETLVELILDFHEERRRWETLQEARNSTK